MGIDISSIKNAKLKELATIADNNGQKNDKLEGNEISLFEASAKGTLTTQQRDGIDAGFGENELNDILKLTKAPVSNPVLTKKDVKEYNNDIKKSVADMVKNGVEPEYLMARLSEKHSSPTLKPFLDEVAYTLNLVNDTKYNSKEDVENIHKQVKAQLKQDDKWDDFHKDLLDSLEDQAKTAQISKEFKTLVAEYESVKATMQNTKIVKQNGDNFKAYVETVKDKLKKDKTWKESYTKEAFEELENYAKRDAKRLVESRLANKTKATTKKGLRKELRGMNRGGDDYQNDAIQELKTDRKNFARKHKVDNRANELSHIDREALKTEFGKRGYQYNFAKKASAHSIGDRIFRKLESYLNEKCKNEDGTYNLTKLSNEILSRVGADYKLDLSNGDDMDELVNVKSRLTDITNGIEFSTNETKVLLNMLGFDREHKDHIPKVVKAVGGLIGGGTAALSASSKFNVTQEVAMEIADEQVAQDIIKQLKDKGVTFGTTKIDGKIGITVLQKYMRDNTITNILKGAGLGVLSSALFDIVFGNKPDEYSCISVSDYDHNDPYYTTPEGYKKHIANRFKNENKKEALNKLVDLYVKEYGEKEWSKHFQNDAIKRTAGFGSTLTPEECVMLKYNKPIDDTPVKPPVDNTHHDEVHDTEDGDGDDIVPNRCPVEMRETVATDTTFTHKVKFGDSWSEIVKAYFPNYKECFGTLEGSKGAIRALKKALATDADGKLNNALYQKLLAGYIPKELNIPAELGGCKRNDEGKVQFKKPVGRPKGYMGAVGARTKTDGSVEVADCTNTRGKGATIEEALDDLNQKTKKHYTEADITERK